MPRPAKSKAKPARKPAPASHPSLPVAPAAFATLVGTLRTSEQREAVYEQMCREFRGYSSLHTKSSRPPADTAQRQLFEQRALELTREPRFVRDFPDTLDYPISYAWRDLVAMRSRRFAEKLRTWSASPEQHLATIALQHLAWMGQVEDLPKLTAAIAKADRRQIAAIAFGCRLAVLHKRAQPGVSDSLRELLTRFILGTSAFSRAPSRDMPTDEAIRSIIELLLQCDRRAALRQLASSQVLRPDNPAADTVLHSLAYIVETETDVRAIRRELDPTAIRSLYEAVSSRPAEHPWRGSILGAALILGVLADPAGYAAEIKTLRPIAKEDPELRRAIATATRLLRAMPNAEILIKRFPSLRKRLQPPAADVLAAGYFVLQIMGDGLAVTLYNHGNLWPAAARGLELIGKRSASTTLTKAATLAFGPEAASITSRQAMKRMSALIEQLPPELDKACTRFEDLSETVFPAMERYIDRQPATFRL
jgi:hypothetical protein